MGHWADETGFVSSRGHCEVVVVVAVSGCAVAWMITVLVLVEVRPWLSVTTLPLVLTPQQ